MLGGIYNSYTSGAGEFKRPDKGFSINQKRNECIYIIIIILTYLNDIKFVLKAYITRRYFLNIKLQTKKFGEIFYKIDDEDVHLIKNHKIYACKLPNNKIYLIRDDKQWLHRIIMKNCPKGMVIDHINGDTLDNTKNNLRITTYSENGKNTNKKRFNDNDVLEILISNLSNNKLAKKFNCSNCLISKIRTGELYDNLFPEILRSKNIKQKQNLYCNARI